MNYDYYNMKLTLYILCARFIHLSNVDILLKPFFFVSHRNQLLKLKMDAEEFCLRWNNHHHVLVSVLDKLLEKESMCDVTLAADHQMIRVHRLVLCACSNYFEVCLKYHNQS